MNKSYLWGILGVLVLGLIGTAVVWEMNFSDDSLSSPSSESANQATTGSLPESTNETNSSLVQNSRKGEKNEKLFQVSLQTLDEEKVTLNQWKGETLVLNFWASWCPFCTDELPAFAQLQSTYDNQLTVIGVNRGTQGETRQTAIDYLSNTEGISRDSFIFLHDSQDKLHPLVGGFSMPETLFIAPDGTIVFHRRGPLEFEQMKTLVEAMDSVDSSN